jgi:hypothetical protein
MLRLRKRGPPLVSSRERRCFRDFAVYVGDRLPDAFAAVSQRISVTQLQRLALAGGGPRRHGRPPGAAVDAHFDFHCGIAARIQDLASVDDIDGGRAVETLRFAIDGSEYEIVKNFPTHAELRSALEKHSTAVDILQLQYYWAVSAVLGRDRRRPGLSHLGGRTLEVLQKSPAPAGNARIL